MRTFFKMIGGVAIIVIAIAVVGSLSDKNRSQTGGTSAPAVSTAAVAPAVAQTPAMPADEAQFVAIVESRADSYKAAANDMARGGERAGRGRALCQAFRTPAVKGWVGTVYQLSSNSSGKGVLEIQLTRRTWLKTWNNELSDISDHTLIEPTSPLFAVAASLKTGDWVRFSGTFLPSTTDCFEEPSLTQKGSMTEPEFVFRFTDIKPAD